MNQASLTQACLNIALLTACEGFELGECLAVPTALEHVLRGGPATFS